MHMKREDVAKENTGQRKIWLSLVGGVVAVWLMALTGPQARAAACGITLSAPLLASAKSLRGASLYKDLRELSDQIVKAITGRQPSQFQRDCEIEALVQAALETSRSSDCRARITVPKDGMLALLSLGALRQSWREGSERQGNADKNILYQRLQCVSQRQADLAGDPMVRQYAAALESAIANEEGGFFEQLQPAGEECAQFDLRLREIKRLKKYEHAEFAIKSAILEYTTLLTSAKALQNRKGCRSYELALKQSIATIDDMISHQLSARSLEGWRWINDLIYAKATYHLALGEVEKARAIARDLEQMIVLSKFQNHYAKGVHPVAETLIKQRDRQEAEDGLPAYQDQVFVSRPLPGYAGKPGRELDSLRRQYYAVADVALAILAVADKIKQSPPAQYPCKRSCPVLMDWLNDELGTALMRRDLKVVAGSYLNQKSAQRGLRSVCANIGKPGKNCPFSLDRHRAYFRVATKELSDAQSDELKGVLEEQGIDSFVSRPRVLSPLGTL